MLQLPYLNMNCFINYTCESACMVLRNKGLTLADNLSVFEISFVIGLNMHQFSSYYIIIQLLPNECTLFCFVCFYKSSLKQ